MLLRHVSSTFSKYKSHTQLSAQFIIIIIVLFYVPIFSDCVHRSLLRTLFPLFYYVLLSEHKQFYNSLRNQTHRKGGRVRSLVCHRVELNDDEEADETHGIEWHRMCAAAYSMRSQNRIFSHSFFPHRCVIYSLVCGALPTTHWTRSHIIKPWYLSADVAAAVVSAYGCRWNVNAAQ